MMREVLERRFKRLMTESPRVPRRSGGRSRRGGDGTFGMCRGLGYLAPLAGRGSTRAARRVRGAFERASVAARIPLTPTLSPQAGRGRPPAGASADDIESDESAETAELALARSRHHRRRARAALRRAGRRSRRSASPTCRWSRIAKGPERDAGRETFFAPGREPFKLKPRDPVLYFVQRLRDEAHRFAIGSHRARRKKDIRESGLQEIPGVGPARKRALLQHFGTLKAIERASPADLAKVEGVSAEMAKKIYDFFHEAGR